MRRGKCVDREIAAFITRNIQPKHPLAIAFFACLKKIGLKPHKAQVACGIDKIATAVDVVCKNAEGELVLVEQKCGYANCAKPRKMKGIFKDLECTADNVAFAQLGMTKLLFEKCFDRKTKALYVRLDNKGASVKSLPTVFKGKVMQELLDQMTAAPRRKKAVKTK